MRQAGWRSQKTTNREGDWLGLRRNRGVHAVLRGNSHIGTGGKEHTNPIFNITSTIFSPPVAGHCCPLCSRQSTGGRLLSAHLCHCWGLQVVLGSNRLMTSKFCVLRQNCPPGCHRILPEQLQVLNRMGILLCCCCFCFGGVLFAHFLWNCFRCTSVWQMWPNWS